MAYDYKELKDANDTTFKAAAVQVESSPNVVFASLLKLDAEKAEDAAHTSGDNGLMILAVRKDSAAALAGTDGDYIPLIVDANGRLHVLDANSATIAALSKAEDAAHSSGDTGIQLLTVRKDTAEAIAGTTGDYAPLEVDASGQLYVSCHFAEALDSGNDSINVNKMGKGTVTTAHNAITATTTSTAITCTGYNSALVYVTLDSAKNWTFKVQGAMELAGTYVDWYELANTGSMAAMSYQCNASRGFIFKGIPDYIKIVATEDEDGATVTVKVQPLNI